MGTRLFSLSLHVSSVPEASIISGNSGGTPVQRLVSETLEAKTYGSICLPITNDLWRKRWSDMCLSPDESDTTKQKRGKDILSDAERWRSGEGGTLRINEVNITKIEEAEGAIGMVADWLQLDSPDEWIRSDSEIALRHELAHASYLGMQTVILPPPRNRAHTTDYARAINACLLNTGITPFMHLSIRVPIYVPPMSNLPPSPPLGPRMSTSSSLASISSGAGIADADMNGTWEMWDIIRNICNYNPRLSLTLDLTAPLPPLDTSLSRWAAEPTRFIFLPATSFVPNSRGYPVLTKPVQTFLQDMSKHRPTVILSATQSLLHATGGAQAYPQYIRHVEKSSPFVKALENPRSVEYFTQGYNDVLQAPLQPLMDNLQSSTYETFERDPVKYQQYEEAVLQALMDRPASSSTVICVAGAGRGPIVARCLTAVIRSGRTARIYALEKNPNAYITLQERKAQEWGDHVTLVFGDMRTATVPEEADILVSELLGSFGDNELSPECLDGAMRFLKPGGISIPCSYTAHLAPISSSKLWNDVCSPTQERKHAETAYVVMFQAVNILSGEGGGASGSCGGRIQETWEFEHPTRDVILDSQGLPLTNTHNTRSAHLRFYIPHAGVLHGLAGYFEACLYGTIGLSIHPERMDDVSPNMLSWFPIWFPFKEPMYLPNNAELDVSMWRLTDKRKVWYEWCAEVFLPAVLLASPGPVVPTTAFSKSGLDNSPSISGVLHGVPSPVVDALTNERSPRLGGESETLRMKINQTTLHNPGGRSSWVGL